MISDTWKYEHFFNLSPTLFFVLDTSFNIVATNNSLGSVLGLSPADVCEKNILTVIHLEDSDRFLNFLLTIDGELLHTEVRFISKDSQYKWLDCDMVRKDSYIYFSGKDITIKKDTTIYQDIKKNTLASIVSIQHELAKMYDSFDLAIEVAIKNIKEITLAVNIDIDMKVGSYLQCIYSYGLFSNWKGIGVPLDKLEYNGYLKEGKVFKYAEIQELYDIFPLLNINNIRSMVLVPINYGKNNIGLLRVVHTDIDYFTREDLLVLQLFSTEIVALYKRFQELEERKKLVKTISHQANHDSLTNLPNRLYFTTRLKEILTDQRATYGAVLLMDLNKFKEVNDTLGHQAGDELLQEVATRLQSIIRGRDLVARLGGDEFAFILINIRKEEIERRVKDVLKIFENSFSVADKLLPISGSIGIALYPEDGKDADELFRLSDMAMYKAKGEGRGFCFAIELTNR